MAVYKPSYCYPYLEAIDARVLDTDGIQYFKCQIDTSNKNITGFRLTILDNENNQIFQGAQISPIEELKKYPSIPNNENVYVNTGFNRTPLNIPFIQNKANQIVASYNSIYYRGEFYVKALSTAAVSNSYLTNASNLNIDGFSDFQENDIIAVTTNSSETIDTPLLIGLYQYYFDSEDGVFKLNSYALNAGTYYFAVENGINNQGIYTVTAITSDDITTYTFEPSNNSLFQYIIPSENTFGYSDIELSNNGSEYKWYITLYQGEKGVIKQVSTNPYTISYDNLSNDSFDMLLQQGTILGTTNNRLQIPLTNEIILNNYTQLVDSIGNNIGTRVNIVTYDETYGHIYPQKDGFTQNQIDQSSATYVYKYNNDPQAVLAQDIVQTAVNTNVATLSGLQTLGGYTLREGDYVLLMGQTNAYLNGPYQASSGTWQRMGGASDWGSLIGRVFLVENGTFRAKNFISQAQAGGTLQQGSQSSGSPLYFNEEQPIILYPDLINYTVTLASISALSTPTLAIDGYALKVGDTVWCPSVTTSGTQGAIYTITSISATEIDFNSFNIPYSSETPVVLQVELGQNYGGKIYNSSSTSFVLDNSPYKATLYKNSTTQTFITPFLGLASSQRLFFNNYFLLNDNTSIKVLKITELDTSNWSITHPTLVTPFTSTSKIKYELKSYFKESDQNNFSLYDTPIVTINPTIKINPTTEIITPSFTLTNTDSTTINMIVGDSYISVPITKQVTVASRVIEALGNYTQAQGANWNYYRWYLLDSSGKILQDSGDIYDGENLVRFYGISNQNIYYVVLIMGDELGNSITTGIEVEVNCESNPLGVKFNATFNCEIQGVELYFAENGFILPTGTGDLPLQITDGSLNYTSPTIPNDGEKAFMMLKNTEGSWTPVLANSSAVGKTLGDGLSFENIYLIDSSGQYEPTSKKIVASIPALMQSEHFLDGNFCGQIIQYTIGIDTNTPPNNTITIKIGIPDSFTTLSVDGLGDASNLNTNRNKLLIKIFCDTTDITPTNEEYQQVLVKGTSGYNPGYLYTMPNATVTTGENETNGTFDNKVCFFKVNGGLLDSNGNATKIGDTDYLAQSRECEFLNIKQAVYKTEGGTTWTIDSSLSNQLPNGLNSNSQINNLCLGSSNNGSIWTDNQLQAKEVAFPSGNNRNFLSTTLSNTWNDSNDDLNNNWTDGSTTVLYTDTQMKAHPYISSKVLKLNIKICNPETITSQSTLELTTYAADKMYLEYTSDDTRIISIAPYWEDSPDADISNNEIIGGN